MPLRFEVGTGRVAMTGESVGLEFRPLDADRIELSSQILAAVCDEHELRVEGGNVLVRIARRSGQG